MIEQTTIAGLKYVIFPPSQLGLYAHVVPGGYQPTGPDEILALTNAEAAINGPMFDVCSGQDLPPGNAARYSHSVCDRLSYKHFDPAIGLNAPGTSLFAGMTFSTTPRGVSVLPGSEVPPDAKVSIQTFPVLLQDGENRASTSAPNNSSEYRSAIALMPDGRLALVSGTGTLHGFADAIARAGVRFAGYTDGGGSTHLVTADHTYGASEPRKVPSWIVVRSAFTAVTGTGKFVAALGLIAVSIGAWWWGRKK